MLAMAVCTWDPKDIKEIVKRFAAWPGAPEGAKIVGAWMDVLGSRAFFLHEVSDVADWQRAAADWSDILKMDHSVVRTAEEFMKVMKEKGWF